MTHAARLIRSIVIWWQNRRSRALMRKAIPVLRELDRQEAECRRKHKRGTARIVRAKREAVNAVLSGRG